MVQRQVRTMQQTKMMRIRGQPAFGKTEAGASRTSKKTRSSKGRKSIGGRVIGMVRPLPTRTTLRPRDQPRLATEASAEVQPPRMELRRKSTRVELVGEPEVRDVVPTGTRMVKRLLMKTKMTNATIATSVRKRRSPHSKRRETRHLTRSAKKCLTSTSHL